LPPPGILHNCRSRSEPSSLVYPLHPLLAPHVTFYNTNGVSYYTSDVIWEWMSILFAPLEYIHHDNISLIESERNVTDADRRDEEGVGTDGLGFKEVSIWWDEKVLMDAITGKEK
jgi:hypothetical protein